MTALVRAVEYPSAVKQNDRDRRRLFLAALSNAILLLAGDVTQGFTWPMLTTIFVVVMVGLEVWYRRTLATHRSTLRTLEGSSFKPSTKSLLFLAHEQTCAICRLRVTDQICVDRLPASSFVLTRNEDQEF